MLDELLTSPQSSQTLLVGLWTSSVCLITKDPQQEYKDLLKRRGIKFKPRDQSLGGGETLKGKFKATIVQEKRPPSAASRLKRSFLVSFSAWSV